jgi:hypothetical protein
MPYAETRLPTLTENIVGTSAMPISEPATEVKPAATLVQNNPELRPEYNISAVLDYGLKFLTVKQDMTIPNISSDIISELTLVIQPNWRGNVFDLKEATWESGDPVESFVVDETLLRILLLDPFMPGELLKLSLAYEIHVPPVITSEGIGTSTFGYTSRQMNFTDWYPFVPPYIDGEGWLVHKPWYYGEHLVYPVADFDVTIHVQNGPENLIIAASAIDLGDEVSARYAIEGARNFVWSISPEYYVFQDKVGHTTVFGYSFPYDVASGEAAFKTTVTALELFSELFGPYPFESISLVQADFDYGMEYTGLYFLNKGFYNTYDGTPSTYLVAISAHETAHQWWYGVVGNDQALEPWLDEALSTYSEKLFYEMVFPQSLDWWMLSRLNYYEPKGWIDSTIYDFSNYREYRDAVYLHGAVFLDELRNRVGDEGFFAFLKDYTLENTYRQVTATNFFELLDEHSDVDLDDLLAVYFKNP